MMYAQQQKKPNREFILPNELFALGLNATEVSLYTYLRFREGRKTYQCWPSYKTIGKDLALSPKTVRKYVGRLVDKGLISTENTTIVTKDGRIRNGSLCYTIHPIKEAMEQYYQRQRRQAELDTARWNAEKCEQRLPQFPVGGYAEADVLT